MKYEDLVAFIKQARETATDETALKAKELYKTFDQIKGGVFQRKRGRPSAGLRYINIFVGPAEEGAAFHFPVSGGK